MNTSAFLLSETGRDTFLEHLASEDGLEWAYIGWQYMEEENPLLCTAVETIAVQFEGQDSELAQAAVIAGAGATYLAFQESISVRPKVTRSSLKRFNKIPPGRLEYTLTGAVIEDENLTVAAFGVVEAFDTRLRLDMMPLPVVMGSGCVKFLLEHQVLVGSIVSANTSTS